MIQCMILQVLFWLEIGLQESIGLPLIHALEKTKLCSWKEGQDLWDTTIDLTKLTCSKLILMYYWLNLCSESTSGDCSKISTNWFANDHIWKSIQKWNLCIRSIGCLGKIFTLFHAWWHCTSVFFSVVLSTMPHSQINPAHTSL